MMAIRAFLDANILFAAAYRPDAGLRRLWRMRNVQLLASPYAIDEARRNLSSDQQRADLEALLKAVMIVPDAPVPMDHASGGHGLPAKDLPILRAARGAHATHLITGDKRHFGHLFNQVAEGVHIFLPRQFLDEFQGDERQQ